MRTLGLRAVDRLNTLSADALLMFRTRTVFKDKQTMKLLFVSVSLACFLCFVVGCNSRALKLSAGALVADGKTPQDTYMLSTDSKKDKAKSLPVNFSHVNHATKNYSVDGKSMIACIECHHT